MNRRTFVGALYSAGLLAGNACAEETPAEGTHSDPWDKGSLLEPTALAAVLDGSAKRPAIVCVTFPVLYRARHIRGAELAGPTNKPEGIAALKQAVSQLRKNAELVVYCGCCPMVKCPNIRPAYRTLKDLGFTDVRVLNLPTNLHVDWTQKGFPVEPPLADAVNAS